MDGVTLTFLVIGGVGVALLLVALLIGEIGDFGHPDADGPFSLPAIAAFVGGVGFIGGLASALLPESLGGWRVLLSVVIGLAGALPLAFGALRMTAALMRMETDRTLTDDDLVGAHGIVITDIGPGRMGEVRLRVGGQDLKYYAKSGTPLPTGTPVYVIDVPSPTSVEVVSTAFDPPPA